MTRVPFLELRPGPDGPAIREAIERVLTRGWFVLGPEVAAFEDEFAAFSGAKHAISVGTGTDALALALRGLGIGPGDEVITTPLSAAFSALAIVMTGATPVFADIDPDRFTLDPRAAEAAITSRTAAVMPVHLYGQAADMRAFADIAARHNLVLLEDACQAHGATADGVPVGTVGAAGGFSFYPTKNLGALGDGGAIITNDAALADKLKRLRNGGQTERYRHVDFGVNTRLDEIQAAILRARLAILPQWTARRRQIATRYRASLRSPAIVVPPELDTGHVYHLFPVRVPSREVFRTALAAHGIETLIHYPIAINRQPAFAEHLPAACPVAERTCEEICSLPLHPLLSDADVDAVIKAVNGFAARS